MFHFEMFGCVHLLAKVKDGLLGILGEGEQFLFNGFFLQFGCSNNFLLSLSLANRFGILIRNKVGQSMSRPFLEHLFWNKLEGA